MPGRSKNRRAAPSNNGSSSRSLKRTRRLVNQGGNDDDNNNMNNSKQRGRPRNRHQRHHHQTRRNNSNKDHNNNEGGDLNQEILQQLQRQRLQQQQQQREEEEQRPLIALGDDERKGSSCLEGNHGDHLEGDRDILLPVARLNRYPFLTSIGAYPSSLPIQSSVLLSHVMCSDPFTRRRLVSLVCARRLSNSCRTLPSAVEFRSGYWTHLFAPMLGDNANDDLYGLLHNPAWIRTFDVWPYSYHNMEPPQIISTGANAMFMRDVHRAEHFPTIDNLNDIVTCRYRALPTDTSRENRASIVFGIVARQTYRSDRVGTYVVNYSSPRYPEREASMESTHSMVNDMCFLSPDRCLLAPLYRRGQTSTFPMILYLDYMPRIGSTSNSNLIPRSDALCIEADHEGGIAGVGFRNGQIIVTDLWGVTLAATTSIQQQGSADNFGSICALTSLGSKQMLARGSSGTCRLFDFRKLSSNQTTSCCTENTSVVTEYVAPIDQISERLTRKCRGIAVDPSQSTVFSPIVSKDEVPSLGMWSLHSGEYVGIKPLAPHPDSDVGDVIPSTTSWGVSWVELCSRATATWEPIHGQDKPRRRPGKFSLWYKTGMSFAGPSLPETAGNIHQAVFDGQPHL